MGDFIRFETMITPIVIQILFWLAVAVSVVVGIIMIITSGDARGILLIVFGPIGARIYAELLMVFFRINDHVRQIAENTRRP
jgi:hypothetical protein